MAYNSIGQITSTTDALGHTSTFAYDVFGNMTSQTDPNSLTSTFAYDTLGNMTTQTDPRGKTTTFSYVSSGCGCGSAGKLTKSTDALGRETKYEYDSVGNLTKTTDALNQVTTNEYDERSLLTKTVLPDSTSATFAYDLLGQQTKTIDPYLTVMNTKYDYLGHVVTKSIGSSPEDITEIYQYDGTGLLTAVVDGRGKKTDYYYDTANRLTKESDPVGKIAMTYYDAAGRVTKRGATVAGTTDPVEAFFQAATGQQTKVKYTNGGFADEAIHEYDGLARLTKITDWTGGSGLRYAFDNGGRLTQIIDYDNSTLTYAYDSGGNITSMTDWHGNATTYTYTDTNALSTITAPGSKTWDYDYDTLDRATTVTLPNGMTTAYAHDTLGRMTTLNHKDGATVKEGWTYQLARNNNIKRISSNVSGSKQLWDYGYDSRMRLADAIRLNESGIPQLRETYTYDAGNNMATKDIVAFEAVVSDDFSDNNYSSSPVWTVNGTWNATNSYLQYDSGGGFGPTAKTPQTEEDYDGWLSYYIGDTSGGKLLQVYLRYDGTNAEYLTINGSDISLTTTAGGGSVLATTAIASAQATWYDLYFKVKGGNIEVWRGLQGTGFKQVFSATGATAVSANTHFMLLSTSAGSRFDDFRIAKPRSTSNSFTDDFSDNDYTSSPAWTVHAGSWSAAAGYLQNTANPSSGPAMRQDFTHGDLTAKYRFRLNSSGTTSTDPRATIIFRGNAGGTTHRLQAEFMKASNQLRLGQWNNGSFSTLVSNTSLTIAYDTDYDVQVVADGRHIEVWWAQVGQMMTKLAETDSATVLEGPRMQFATSLDTVLHYDNIEVVTPDPKTTTFTYDDANELLTMVAGGTTTNFTYDNWGRQVSKVQGGYTAVNGWRYDNKLHTLTTNFPGEATSTWNYTGEGKLRSFVTGGVTTKYRYDVGWRLINREDGSGALTDTFAHNMASPIGLALGSVAGATPASGTWSYYNTDHLGSPRRIRNASKGLTGAVDFSPYGEKGTRTVNAPLQQFTGHLGFASVSSYFAPNRSYNSAIARWNSPDPLGIEAGFNMYNYVLGNPVNFNDPMGLKPRSPALQLNDLINKILKRAADRGKALLGRAGEMLALKRKYNQNIANGYIYEAYNNCKNIASLAMQGRKLQIAFEYSALGSIVTWTASAIAMYPMGRAVSVAGKFLNWTIGAERKATGAATLIVGVGTDTVVNRLDAAMARVELAKKEAQEVLLADWRWAQETVACDLKFLPLLEKL